jgi:hypothetical protein
VSLPAILRALLEHNAELAQIVADDPFLVDSSQRKRLAAAALRNAQLFQNFVDTFMIEIKARPGAPLPAGVCPHCFR